jgi:hypothetical protein
MPTNNDRAIAPDLVSRRLVFRTGLVTLVRSCRGVPGFGGMK